MNGLTGESIYGSGNSGTVVDQIARDAANVASVSATNANTTAVNAYSLATTAKSTADTAIAAVNTSNGRFTKGTSYDFFNDGIINLRWDGYDEIMIKHMNVAGTPTDIYAHATLVSTTSTVGFPSSNPMIVSSVENDFAQSAGAMYVEFNIRSDSDSTFPYYEVTFQTTGTSGLTQAYWSVKKLT